MKLPTKEQDREREEQLRGAIETLDRLDVRLCAAADHRQAAAWPAEIGDLEPQPLERPRIVCLCGSTRFKGAFDEANYQETMAGKIVLSVGFYMHATGNRHGEGVGATPEQKVALDELHFRKIDLADEVLALNVDGYIGESTRREIAYAQSKGKPVRYLEAQAAEPVSPPLPQRVRIKEGDSWVIADKGWRGLVRKSDCEPVPDPPAEPPAPEPEGRVDFEGLLGLLLLRQASLTKLGGTGHPGFNRIEMARDDALAELKRRWRECAAAKRRAVELQAFIDDFHPQADAE